MAISMQEVASVLQQAERITGVQLSLQEFAGLLAIPSRESGYDPNAFNPNAGTGDYSIGLWQENFIGSMRSRINEISALSPNHPGSPDAIKGDALSQAIGAILLVRDSRGSGDGLRPWGGYKGMSDTYSVPGSIINQANQLASQIKSGGGVPVGGGTPFVPGAPNPPTGGQPGGAVVTPPSDGRLVRSPWDGKLFLFYDVGGVIVDYEVPEDGSVNVSGFQETQMSREEFTGTNAVQGGSAMELQDVVRSYGTYSSFFDSILKQVMGEANPARNDPGVRRIIAEFAARPDMSPTELQNRLQGTGWYQAHTEAQLQWDEKPQAEKDKLKQDMAAQMAQSWLQYIGVQLDPNDPRIVNYIDELASGKRSFGNWIESVVKPAAMQDPESPFSRQLRDEQKARKQHGVDIENTMQQVRDTGKQWGIQWSPDTIRQWATDIQNNDASMEDLVEQLKTQARQLYPNKDPDLPTVDYAGPFIETYRRVLEKDADIFNPKIQQAMTAGTPIWDLEQQLKNSDDWLGTKNFRSDISGAIGQAGRMMGFVK